MVVIGCGSGFSILNNSYSCSYSSIDRYRVTWTLILKVNVLDECLGEEKGIFDDLNEGEVRGNGNRSNVFEEEGNESEIQNEIGSGSGKENARWIVDEGILKGNENLVDLERKERGRCRKGERWWVDLL